MGPGSRVIVELDQGFGLRAGEGPFGQIGRAYHHPVPAVSPVFQEVELGVGNLLAQDPEGCLTSLDL